MANNEQDKSKDQENAHLSVEKQKADTLSTDASAQAAYNAPENDSSDEEQDPEKKPAGTDKNKKVNRSSYK